MDNAPKEALGQSDVFLEFMEALSRAARVDRPVLILGERGTGKELAAARLHFLSPRWGEPLVTLNSAALAPTLIEDELFGHEAGAFTGAAGRRQGRFEAAHRGTLFLDEIANMPLTAQEKVLRAVEYGSFERVGGSDPVTVDVRIVGATNRNLLALCAAGRFHPDLLDRLSFEVLMVPPLRERRGDVELLANHFASRMALDLGRAETPEFHPQALSALTAHPWPGNVRELKNVVERAVYKSDDPLIRHIAFDPFAGCRLPAETPPPGPAAAPAAPEMVAPSAPDLPVDLPAEVRRLEIDLLVRALGEGRHNQRRAAELLGLTYHQLRGLLRKHGGPEAVLAATAPSDA